VSNNRLAVVAAGGTGGHLFPAQALAEELTRRGWRIALATDDRGAQYAGNFPAERRIPLSAATYRNGDPVGMAKAGIQVLAGRMQAAAAFKRYRPNVVVGFGGYPSLPGLLAALGAKIPTVIHEQNAVLGRVNRYLAPKVTAVACAFPILERATPQVAGRAVAVGNPVRPEIRALYGRGFSPPGRSINILITGGSQGARLLSELMPPALAQLPESLRMRLKVQQQTRADSMENARRIFDNALVEAEVAPFFRDMAGRLGAADLVIGRAGASTVSEIAVAGKPSILVPLKIAMDDHQRFNAKLLSDAGAAEVALEDGLTVDLMTSALTKLLSSPARLARMGAAAHSVARPDAAERLADLVEATAR
jgi:UDP-N-acetylglucosamine--N-acetylmuramyl-(pentapeptide) pyrophosphoryl-undecaprenol N-acetylglucosamine transferase